MIVLGIHGGVTLGQHEPSAALVIDGKLAAVCEEERYLRVKSCYGRLPQYSIEACLKESGVSFGDIDLVVSPGVTYGGHQERLKLYLTYLYGGCPEIELIHHQIAHASAAFYSSGWDGAACLTLDATGDGLSGIVARASSETGIEIVKEISTDESIGFFYSLMTYYLGFSEGDEYKVMGLAPYGKPSIDLSKIIKISKSGCKLDNSFVRSEPPLRSPYEPMFAAKLVDLLGNDARLPGGEVTQYHKDIARSTQAQMEKCLISMVQVTKSLLPEADKLCYSGGVALNCAANQNLEKITDFSQIYVPAFSSDRGLAVGAAYYGAAARGDQTQATNHAYLGSSYSDEHILKELEGNGCSYEVLVDPSKKAAELLSEGMVLGWFQGRSEAGARSLGNRSILASAQSTEMRDIVNARIKYREEFRPFAPACLYEKADELFETEGRDLPYMCFTVNAREEAKELVPAVVHVDGTARLQTIRKEQNGCFYDLIDHYNKITSVPVVLNTSFNLKGQPIVETPRDALMTFFGCGLDVLIMGSYLVRKQEPTQ
ncbi:MAG: hypothetical protein OQJ97_08050 [Rhodospirillales bacterium]|nr:hypothetical protein [Rhodospirillales bacterium]